MPGTATVVARIHAALADGTLTAPNDVGSLAEFAARFTTKVSHPTLIHVARRVDFLRGGNYTDEYVIDKRLHAWLCDVDPIVHLGEVNGKYSDFVCSYLDFELTEDDDEDVVIAYMQRRGADVIHSLADRGQCGWVESILPNSASSSHICLDYSTSRYVVLPKAKLVDALGVDAADPRRLKRVSADALKAHGLQLPAKPGAAKWPVDFTFDELFTTDDTLAAIYDSIDDAIVDCSAQREYVSGKTAMRWLLAEYGVTLSDAAIVMGVDDEDAEAMAMDQTATLTPPAKRALALADD